MNFKTIVLGSLIFLEFCMILYFLFKVDNYKNLKHLWIIVLISIIFFSCTIYSEISIREVIFRENILTLLTIFLPLLLGKRKYARNLFLFMICTTGLYLILVLSILIWISLFSEIIPYLNLLIMIKTLQLLYIYLLIKILSLIDYIPNKILFLIISLCLVIKALTLILIIFSNQYDQQLGYVILYISTALFVAFVIILVIIYILSTHLEKLCLHSLKNKQLCYIEEYKDTALDVFDELKAWNHDLRNHMSVMISLLESKSDKDLINYIHELNIEISNLEKTVYTNNIVLDSLLNAKIKSANDRNIDVNLKVDFNQELLLSDLDIVGLLSNLLDNSIESCEYLTTTRWIDIYLRAKDNKLLIKVSNPTDGDMKISNFKTRKNSINSGIGMLQIDRITDKYHGHVNRYHNDNIFNTTILMINKKI